MWVTHRGRHAVGLYCGLYPVDKNTISCGYILWVLIVEYILWILLIYIVNNDYVLLLSYPQHAHVHRVDDTHSM